MDSAQMKRIQVNRKWLSTASLLAMATVLVTIPADANNTEIRVAVLVSAEGLFANEFRSCINREIRKLGDVEIVESDARFTLQVVATPTKVNEEVVGYTASAVVLDHNDANILSATVWRDSIGDGAKAVAEQIQSGTMLPSEIKGLGRIRSHVVHMRLDVQRLCVAITSEIDVEVIETARRETMEQRKAP
jgi:hypothetical protein